MARPRKTAVATETPVEVVSNENTNTRRMKMPLSPDQVRQIYANRRTKGLYDTKLGEFIESGDNGISVKEEWPEFADKKAQTLKQGFENSKDRKGAPDGSDNVDVIVDGDNVYLINKVVAGVADELAEAVA
jgi:hypothetical protein